MEVQAEIKEARLRAKIGREIEAIVDDVQDNIAVARSMGRRPGDRRLAHVQQADCSTLATSSRSRWSRRPSMT